MHKKASGREKKLKYDAFTFAECIVYFPTGYQIVQHHCLIHIFYSKTLPEGQVEIEETES